MEELASQLPPQDLDAEMAVLGAMMAGPESIPEVRRILTRESFATPQHGVAFQVLLDQFDAGDRHDVFETVERLRRFEGKDWLAGVGGVDYLVQLSESAPDWTNAGYYARIVRDRYQRRELMGVAYRLMGHAQDLLTEPADTGHAVTQEIQAILSGGSEHKPREIHPILRRLPAELSGPHSGYLPTPLNSLNTELGGIERAAYTVLAGRPSAGKTAFGVACALTAAQVGPVVMFSLEMRDAKLALRILAYATNRSMGELKHHTTPDALETHVAFAVQHVPAGVLIYDDVFNIRDIVAEAKRLIRARGVVLVIIDYLQIAEPHGHHGTREREVGSMSNELKRLAQEQGVAVLALAQLNRDVEKSNRRPNIADLRDSGSLEQDADCVWLIWADDSERTKARSAVILHAAKNRQGPTKEFTMSFNKPTMTFSEGMA